MIIREYGDPAARVILVQPVGQHELPLIDDEIVQIGQMTDRPFRYLAVQVENWNRDLSPWPAPAVFGDEDFGDGAEALLEEILPLCAEQDKDYIIGGYSLAGLFALWSACRTGVFSGAAAASPSLWFPGFSAYMKEKGLECETVYLSLGMREEKTRNPVMRTVGDCARHCYAWMKEQGVNCTLEWNPGNHFKEPGLRTAKAFAWVMNHMREKPAHAAEKRNMKKPENFC